MTDTERLDWLEDQDGAGLISDDNGHWALTVSGTQNVPIGQGPQNINTLFWIKKHEWHKTIREAIDAKMKEWGE